jgi:predicted DNA-binding transcriptional regulator AlpA
MAPKSFAVPNLSPSENGATPNPLLIPLTTKGPNLRRRRRLSPLVADARLLARLLGLGVRTIRSMDYSGKLPHPLKLSGTRTVWVLAEIRRWLAAGAPNRKAWEAMKKA